MGTLDELIARELGVKINPVIDPEVTQVEVADTIVLRNNPDRLGFLLVNLGANPIFLRPGSVVTSTTGVRIAHTGGQMFVWWREDLQITGWDWHGIATGGVSAIVLLDYIADTRQSE